MCRPRSGINWATQLARGGQSVHWHHARLSGQLSRYQGNWLCAGVTCIGAGIGIVATWCPRSGCAKRACQGIKRGVQFGPVCVGACVLSAAFGAAVPQARWASLAPARGGVCNQCLPCLACEAVPCSRRCRRCTCPPCSACLAIRSHCVRHVPHSSQSHSWSSPSPGRPTVVPVSWH